MKQVPYKCRFGHVTIVSFQSRENKASVIACEECLRLAGIQRKVFTENSWYIGRNYSSQRNYVSTYIWPVKHKTSIEIVEAIRI